MPLFEQMQIKKRPVLISILWIPISIALFAKYQIDQYNHIGVNLCGNDLYLMTNEPLVFFLAVCIPTLLGITSFTLLESSASIIISFKARVHISIKQIMYSTLLTAIFTVYIGLCIFIESRIFFAYQDLWNESKSAFWYTMGDICHVDVSELYIIMLSMTCIFLAIAFEMFLFYVVLLYFKSQLIAWLTIVVYCLLSTTNAIRQYLPTKLLSITYYQAGYKQYPILETLLFIGIVLILAVCIVIEVLHYDFL